jgi:hypothetical protein
MERVMPQRAWAYIEPGPNNEPVRVVVSEDELRQTFWPWWQERMIRAGKENLVTFENCVEDFIVVHWAELVDA